MSWRIKFEPTNFLDGQGIQSPALIWIPLVWGADLRTEWIAELRLKVLIDGFEVFTNTAFKTGLTRNLRCCAPQRGHWPHLSEDGTGFAAEPGLRQLPRAGEAGTRQWHGVAHVRPVSCLFSITTLASPLLRAAEHLPEWRVDPRHVHLTHGSYGSISPTQNAHWQKSENFPCLRTFQGADAFYSMPPPICIYGPPCGSFREIP